MNDPKKKHVNGRKHLISLIKWLQGCMKECERAEKDTPEEAEGLAKVSAIFTKKDVFLVFLECVLLPIIGVREGTKMFAVKKYSELVTRSDEAFAILLLENLADRFIHCYDSGKFEAFTNADRNEDDNEEVLKDMPRYRYSTQRSFVKKRVRTEIIDEDDRPNKKQKYKFVEKELWVTKRLWNDREKERFALIVGMLNKYFRHIHKNLDRWCEEYYSKKGSNFYEEIVEENDMCNLDDEEDKLKLNAFLKSGDEDALGGIGMFNNLPDFSNIQLFEL